MVRSLKWHVSYVLILMLICGCKTTRSISYYKSDYNPSYKGELSVIEFIKDVSSVNTAKSEKRIKVEKGDRIIVIQSGQLRPDSALLSSFSNNCNVIPISGIPSNNSNTNISLRDAAKAGGVSKILAYWGNIETSIQPKGYKAVSWVPIVGYYIPDENHRIRVSLFAIVSEVSSGQWTDYNVTSSETQISLSSVSGTYKESREIERLKTEAYHHLLRKLMN